MHELVLVQKLLSLVEEEAAAAQAQHVVAVTVSIGALSHVEPSALQFAFAAASRGTASDGAQLLIERVVATARCLSCDIESPIETRGVPCPHCGEFSLVVASGDALRLVRLEVW